MSRIDPGMKDMLDTFIHETESMLEQLDEILLESERARSISDENISSIFRITHTIKGSGAMMGFEEISNVSHAVEDVFYILRDEPQSLGRVFDTIFDLVFQTSDFLKRELEKLHEEDYTAGNPEGLITRLHEQVRVLKGEDGGTAAPAPKQAPAPTYAANGETYTIHVVFEDDCQMENMRAYMLMTQLQHCCDELSSVPPHPETDPSYSEEIVKNGFTVHCRPSRSIDAVCKVIEGALNIKTYEVTQARKQPVQAVAQAATPNAPSSARQPEGEAPAAALDGGKTGMGLMKSAKQSLISVNQSKLDHLMDLVGEIVTAESMVARNPDLDGLKLDNFNKSFRELRKLTDELQDIVMSVRMVPLQSTFNKMDRIVRDMSKKLGKKVELVTEGGDTEVDKTINDAIVDPFMHMIRNSMDHGVELPEERLALGKPETARIFLSARNVGGEILIEVSDDGRGLNAEALLAKASKNGLLTKPASAYTEKEAFGLIMMAGFSTNTEVTEFSGRGVGMDVVRKNVEQVGGAISISSVKNQGTTFTIKIPLTLAIVDGMNLSVGNTVFTLPISSINQSFKITDEKQIIQNTNGTEMIMLRGACYPVLRLNRLFGIEGACENIKDGIMIQVENSNSGACLFADELLGEYQVVVKPFPVFLSKYDLKRKGLSGCSILGDGSISLILDANSMLGEI